MITLAELKDIDIIMNIIDNIKDEMRALGNPQWGSTEDNYPPKERFIEDINNKRLYKYQDNNIIMGVISLIEDEDREYDELLPNNKNKSVIIHRLAVDKNYRKQKIGIKLMNFAEEYALKKQIRILKSDTEISNKKMNNLFIKLGYQYKGQFIYDDYPGKYNYYEKELERS